MRATCVRRRRCRAEQSSVRSRSLLCFVRALRLSLCLSVCLPCLVCFTFILATGRGCSNVPMFDCSTVSTAFAYSNDDTCVRSRYSLRRRRRRRRRLLIGLCCYSSSLFVLLLVLLLFLLLFLLLSFYSSCPLVPSAPCRTLLFNIFVPLVLNFSTFCASPSLFRSPFFLSSLVVVVVVGITCALSCSLNA